MAHETKKYADENNRFRRTMMVINRMADARYLVLVFIVHLAGCNILTTVVDSHADVPRDSLNNRSASLPLPNMLNESLDADDTPRKMMEQRWLKILHLSTIPENIHREVPLYMQALFDLVEMNASTNAKLDSSVSGERVAWAVKASTANYEADRFSTSFNVLLDFNTNIISRVELVFEGNTNSSETLIQGRKRTQSFRAAVEVCSSSRETCYQSDAVQHLRLEGVNGSYEIYDVTQPFLLWRENLPSNESSTALIRVARSSSVEATAHVSGDYLLIIYQNLSPDPGLNRKLLRARRSQTVGRHEDRRQRREAGRASSAGICRLHEWNIDFSDLGWDWIIVPTRYDAGFCDGSCPRVKEDYNKVNWTNHAFLRTVYHDLLGSSPAAQNVSQVPLSSCVPIRYSPLNILYKANNDTFVVLSAGSMIATSCGCL